MKRRQESAVGTISIKLPVNIDYSVIETVIRERMVGETIQVEKENGEVTKYAKILDVSLEKSPEEEYDLAVHLKLKTLTSFFSNKEASIFLQASINFDVEEQAISVKDYKLKVNSQSWLMNKSLQTVANTLFHNSLKSKMKFDFLPDIEKKLFAINEKLKNKFEVTEGVFLTGSIGKFKIIEIQPQVGHLRIMIEGDAKTVVDVKKINI